MSKSGPGPGRSGTPTILFYDLNAVGILLSPASVAQEVATLRPSVRCVFAYDEGVDPTPDAVAERLPSDATVVRSSAQFGVEVGALVDTYQPDLVVVMAQRIPDVALLAAARSRGIRTVLIQHGLLIPFMRREKRLFLEQGLKTARYLRMGRKAARELGLATFPVLRELMSVFLRGIAFAETSLPGWGFNADRVLTYGEGWNEYFGTVYGYAPDQCTIVGYPDARDVPSIQAQPRQPGACYVAQTLVEDGRLARTRMLDFVGVLARVATDERPLFVKLHPRSDRSLYEALESRPVTFMRHGLIPNCRSYLGHYSTLLTAGAYVSPRLCLWEFPGHPIPDYLQSLAETVTDDPDEFVAAAARQGPSTPPDELEATLDRYFYLNPRGAIKQIAVALLEECAPPREGDR